jgi:hypothetical protein
MPQHDELLPISAQEQDQRLQRVVTITKALGFVGTVEYRHASSESGGAQYCPGQVADHDIMLVYAEAFDRDADPTDFALEAIVAHECGHQRLIRDSKLRAVVEKFPGPRLEEVLASVVGSVLLGESEAARTLIWKATAELGDMSVGSDAAVSLIDGLERLLRTLL